MPYGVTLPKNFDTKVENGVAVIVAKYDMPAVKAQMQITYTINGEGQIAVEQAMTTDKEAKVSNMFRYGMRMELPARFNELLYYGRGEVENYCDRKSCADIGIYKQTVAEQYHEQKKDIDSVHNVSFNLLSFIFIE